jgi:hypothetical protein
MPTIINPALVDGLRPYYVGRNDIPQNAAMLNSFFMNMGGMRGYWNMASRDQNAAVYDMSGQGRTLTNTATVTFNTDLLTPYAVFGGANYLQRADEAALDITTNLTVVALCRFTNTASAVENVITKRAASGQLSYYLRRTATGLAEFVVSSNGTLQTLVTGTYAIPADTWVLMVGRYTPSTALDVWGIPFVTNGTGIDIDDYKATNTTSIPAAIFNSTAVFAIGATGVPNQYMTGRVMYAGLYALALVERIIFSIYELAKPVVGT